MGHVGVTARIAREADGIAKDTAIITFGGDDWADTWQTRHQFMSRLGRRGWPVVYSTGALSVWQIGKPAWRAATWRGRIQATDDIMVDHPGRLLPQWPKSRQWNRLALRRQTRRLMRAIGWKRAKHRIAYLFHPQFWPYVEHLGDCHVVFHMDDAFNQMPGWNDRLELAQSSLADRADLLIGTAQSMLRTLPGNATAKAKELPNAADADAFIAGRDAPCPDDLAPIPHPRIGYIGSINIKVDIGLIAATAAARPDWHWAIVGPRPGAAAAQADADWQAGLAACEASPNVHFLGSKHHTELPAYASHNDVNTMCYRTDGSGWWRAVYPLKLHEYLGAGKPIVSADLETVRPFDTVVDIASGRDAWIAAIDRALSEGGVGTVASRHAVARQNTWDRRVDQLEQWLVEMLGGQAAGIS